ncbi:hypothetical protein D3C83_25230 [compost metagenome]
MILGREAFALGELEELESVERPAVRAGDRLELQYVLGERDVQALLATVAPLEQELHGERRFAGAGIALDEVHPVARQPAAKEEVEPGDAGRNIDICAASAGGHHAMLAGAMVVWQSCLPHPASVQLSHGQVPGHTPRHSGHVRDAATMTPSRIGELQSAACH